MDQIPSPRLEKGRQILRGLREKIIANKRLAIGMLVVVIVSGGVSLAAQKSATFSKFLASMSGGLNNNSSPRLPGAKGLDSPSMAAHQDCAFGTSQKPDNGKVLFKEVAWMGDKDSANNEWLSLQKIAEGELDLGGYQILNENQKIKIVLPAKAVLIDTKPLYVLARKDGIFGVKADVTYSGAMRNANEALRLFDSQCRLLDEVLAHPAWPAGNNILKQTMKRDLATLKWFDLSHPPQAKAGGAKVSSGGQAAEAGTGSGYNPALSAQQEQILIALVTVGVASNSSVSFIELYNPGPAAVNLTGWSVRKKSSTGAESSLVSASRLSGKIIAAGKYFLLGSQTGPAGTPDVVWPASYQLAYKNNSVTVYNKSGQVIDTAAWSELPAGKSLARVSWNSAAFAVQDTPVLKNSLGN
jgi:hypothetical protein